MGKKRKKTRLKTKKRHVVMQYNIKKEDAPNGLVGKIIGSEFVFWDKITGKPIRATKSLKYRMDRQSKHPKIISQLYNVLPNNMNIDYELANYDYIVGVDTNTRSINDEFLSIGTFVWLGPIHKAENNKPIVITTNFTYNTYFKNISKTKIDAIEQFVWICSISIMEQMDIFQGKKIGFVIDSSLGEIEKINSESRKILNSYILPTNYTLLYASADKRDTVFNKIIRQADKQATAFMLQEEGLPKTILKGNISFENETENIIIDCYQISPQEDY